VNLVEVHPNKVDALVFARGDLWVVNPSTHSAALLLTAIESVLPIERPDGWILNRQGLALPRLGPDGLKWHTRRLSWDGFDQLSITQSALMGLAWSPLDEQWRPFNVDVHSGRSSGGSYLRDDSERWERLAG
jgi:hypothetical protein